jgi:hypothetical protein
MDQFEFIRKINIERFQSLLATSVDDAERRNDTDITDQRSSQGSIAHIQTEDGVNKNVSDADLSNLALSERVTDALRRSLAPSAGSGAVSVRPQAWPPRYDAGSRGPL